MALRRSLARRGDGRAEPRRVRRPIYLDYQATTPLAPEARAAMLPLMEQAFGNPHSPHRMGREAKAAVELARERVAAPFGLGGRLLFTSGATEALNWAIKGIAETSERRRIVVTAIEHAAVLDTAGWLAGRGHDVVVLPVGSRRHRRSRRRRAPRSTARRRWSRRCWSTTRSARSSRSPRSARWRARRAR